MEERNIAPARAADPPGGAGRWLAAVRRILPGLAAAGAVAAVGEALGALVPVVGGPVFAIVIGIAVAVVRGPSDALRPGLGFSAKRVLQGSIVVLGTGLSLRQVATTGASSFPVMVGSLVAALGGAWIVGRALAVDRDARTLIGVGTAICGVSAIAATDAVIGAAEADVAYSVATIFTFNVAAVLTFPTIGHLLHLTPHSFGLWAGTAVNDVSSVVAAASIFGKGATGYAVVVKLTRTLMIIPIAIALGRIRARDATRAAAPATAGAGAGADAAGAVPVGSALRRLSHFIPLFIAWFLVAVAVNSAGLVPAAWHRWLSDAAQGMITVALAAIGLSTRLRDIRRAGFRPLALGAVLWAMVALTSLGLQLATGTLH